MIRKMKKITSKLLLRISAIIMLLHSIGHTVGFSNWQSPNGKVPVEVVRTMQDTHFLVRGKDTTMAASFSGSGYMVSIFLLLLVSILWTISNRTGKDASTIALLTGIALALLVVVEFLFFFPMVAMLSLTAATLVFISLFKLNKAVPS
jgi:hypothetical protein